MDQDQTPIAEGQRLLRRVGLRPLAVRPHGEDWLDANDEAIFLEYTPDRQCFWTKSLMKVLTSNWR
jgi:hypothetical protein